MPQQEPDAGRVDYGWATVLLLVALVLDGLALPWALLAGIPALAAIGLGVRAVVRRARQGRGAGAVWAGVGIAFAGYVLAGVVVEASMYDTVKTYRECTSAANTSIAQTMCDDVIRQRVGSLADTFLDR